MSDAVTAKQIYDFCRSASGNFEKDSDALSLLLNRYKANSAVSAAPGGSDTAEAVARRVNSERLLELCSITKNHGLRYDIDWASVTAQGAGALQFFENNIISRVEMSARSVCFDDIALSSWQNIHIIHIDGSAPSSVSVDTKNGIISLHSQNIASLSDCPSDREISVALDKALRLTFQRNLRRFVKEQIPQREREIREAFGSGVRIVAELETFTTPKSLEFADNVLGLRLLMAVRTLAADETARDMSREALKEVKFRNVTSDSEYVVRFDVASGVLLLACQCDRELSESGAKLMSHAEIFEEVMRHLNIRVAQKSKELREKLIPEREKELQDILGVSVSYQVSYASFTDENQLNFVDNVAGARVSMACRCIFGADKDTLIKSFKKVRIVNVDAEAKKSIDFSNGTLTLTCAFSAGLSGAFTDGDIKAVLTKK